MSNSSKNSSMSKSSLNNSKENRETANSNKQEYVPFQGIYENYNPRSTRIDEEHFQAQVPNMISKRSKAYPRYKKHRNIQELFDPEKVDRKKLDEYLQFAKSLTPETSGPNSGMLMSYNNRMEEKSLEFLHNMNYSFTKAKFYLLFPTLLKWNEYSSDTPLEISEKEMEEKIAFFITQMQETKSSQQEKWRGELQELLSARVPLLKLMSFLEQGKTMGVKNDIPDFLKEMLSKTASFSKEIKQKLHQKLKLESLELLKKQCEEYKIISNEMIELEEAVERSRKWIESASRLGEGPYLIKDLEVVTNDYKNVPLDHDLHKKYKRIIDGVKDLLDKLPSFTKSNKTRYNNAPDKLPVKTALEYSERITSYCVECEEFSVFQKTLEQSLEIIESVKMTMQDERVPKTSESVLSLYKELESLSIIDPLQYWLKKYVEYLIIVERMYRNLPFRNKIGEIEDDLKSCKSKNFMTPEVTSIRQKVNKLKELYSKAEDYLKAKKSFNVKQLFQNYKTVTNSMPEENALLDCIKIGEEYHIDRGLLDDLRRIKGLTQAWKSKIRENWTFEEIVKGVSEGFALGFKHPELAALFERGKKLLIWTIQAINLIKKYENDFKSKILNESYTNDLLHIISRNIISFEDDYKQVVFLTTEKPSESQNSLELEKLLQLKEKCESWSNRATEELQKKRDYDPETIRQLIEESTTIPSDLKLKNQLIEVNAFVQWINKVKEALYETSENQPLVERLAEKNIVELESSLDGVQDFYEQDVVKFLVTHKKMIHELLETIASPDVRVKVETNDVNYLNQLLEEEKNIKLPEEDGELVEQLQKKIDTIQEWTSSYQKLRGIGQKKKGGRGGRGRKRGHKNQATKKEDPEKMKIETASEAGPMEVESEKPTTTADQAEEGEEHQEKIEALAQSEVKSEASSALNQPKAEAVESEKMEILTIPDEKKEEQTEEIAAQVEKDKLGTLFSKDSDNFYFFFKLPLLISAFHQGLAIHAPIEDLKSLKQYLQEIYDFIEDANIYSSRKLELDDLEQLITTGNKLKLYLIEIEKCQKLYKWGCSWLEVANQVLATIPFTKQMFKKSDEGETHEERPVVAKNVDLSQYYITFDEDKFTFLLTRADHGFIDQDDESQTQDHDSTAKPETPQKRISKREKKINRKFQESGFAVFSPESTPAEEKNPRKPSASLLGKRPNRRKSSIQLPATEKKKKPTPKELTPPADSSSAAALKEEDPDEHYCICRKGHDGLAYMIACDKCGEWFHGECIGLPKSMWQKNIDFSCFACVARYHMDAPVELPDFVWNRANPLELQQFLNIVQEGRMIPLKIPEIDEMIELENKVKSFIHRSGLEVQKGAQLEHIQNLLELSTVDKVLKEFEKAQVAREKYIKTLYLESLGYPVKLKLADELIAILQKRDLATEIIKQLLNGKQNSSKAMKKILVKNYSYINIDRDPELKALYEKLKTRYELTSKIAEKLNQLIQQKGEPDEFGQYLQFIDENSIQVEKLEVYKQIYEDFHVWENNVRYAIQNKLDKETMTSLQRDYISLSFKSNLIGVLNDIISEAEEWQKKALNFMNDGANSGIDETELLEEGHRLRCKTPFVDYLETRRQQQQQWLVNPYGMQNSNQGGSNTNNNNHFGF